MFTYQKTNRYFAQISDGLEKEAAAELKTLGGEDVKTVYRGVYFSGDQETLYRVNYQTRLCSRILAQLLRFDCHSTKYLHKTASKINWQELMGLKTTFAVNATVSHSHIRHSQYAALCLKDAIVDAFRERTGSRPDVDTDNPDLLLNLHIENNRASVSLDTSGGSLHRRGYRLHAVEAPMQETLAAAIIHLSGWDGERPLTDPMCGSGTLIAEALMHTCRIPAGYLKKRFGFENLPEFDQKLWAKVRKEADAMIRKPPPGLISGSDIADEAVEAARKNLALLPYGDQVRITKSDFNKIKQIKDGVIISNPPYGIRIHKQNIDTFIREFGRFLKDKCHGSTVYLYFGKEELAEQTGLKTLWRRPLNNGGLAGVLICCKIP